MKDIERRQFWDEKILKWEGDKYDKVKMGVRRLLDVNQSLKARMDIASGVLKKIAKNRTILEIGCGTARLLPVLIGSGAKKYIGIDVSKVAIERARSRVKALGADSMAEFHQADAGSLQDTTTDICFSLGLLDWLDPDTISQMIRRIHCQYYLHSFSERRPSLKLLLHRLYVYCLYGRRTGSYRPRYYSSHQMVEIFQSCYGAPPQCYRSRRLSFGGFVFKLPNGVDVQHE
ncbi:MAG: class I SAM-dependent methyltransferase [Deltaproteobacteria bacterium]|nr:class I SAM-dependent methyltransferase [Deltaproteobacteria bacterium]